MQGLITNRLYRNGQFTTDRNPNGITFWMRDRAVQDAGDPKAWIPADITSINAAITASGLLSMLFIHGFNNGEVKVSDTLQEMTDRLPNYNTLAFDWYSAGNVLLYEEDRSRARTSVLDLMTTLVSLVRLDLVVAHSMGNYVLELALKQLGMKIPIIQNLVMVAADVDNFALKDQCFVSVKRGLVLYDLLDGALLGSSALHAGELNGVPRLGLTGPLVATMPAWFTAKDCTSELLHVIDPISKHGAFFTEPWFYQILEAL